MLTLQHRFVTRQDVGDRLVTYREGAHQQRHGYTLKGRSSREDLVADTSDMPTVLREAPDPAPPPGNAARRRHIRNPKGRGDFRDWPELRRGRALVQAP